MQYARSTFAIIPSLVRFFNYDKEYDFPEKKVESKIKRRDLERKRDRQRKRKKRTSIGASVSNFSHFHGTFHPTLNKRELPSGSEYKSRQSLSSKVWRGTHAHGERATNPSSGRTKRRNANKCDSVCRPRSSLSN